MNIEQLDFVCRQSTRNAFEEFKRQIEFALFPFDDTLKINLQKQMLEQIGQKVIKTMYKYEVNKMQLKVIENYLRTVINLSNFAIFFNIYDYQTFRVNSK